MRSGLFLTTLIGLAGASHISSAADASWVATAGLENGTSPYCAGGQFNGPPFSGDWQVNVKGNTLTLASRATNRAYTVALQADGSGKGVGKDDKNRAFYVTFDRGSGARPFQVTNSITPCTTVFCAQGIVMSRMTSLREGR